MYTAFHGLREKPFALSPDPRFLFLAESHREALAHLLYGIEQGEGFIVITGEVGTGKTTLCRTLLGRLGTDTEVAFVFNPRLSARELLQSIHAELGLSGAGESWRELVDELNRFLVAKKAEGRRVLLVIDEAQQLEDETLEQIRLLSNFETETSKLIQIVLLGQPELDVKLSLPELRQLRQRITVYWKLAALSVDETASYVRHRLRIAASAPRSIFSAAAEREVRRRSGGIPRVVNVICDRALLAAYAAGAREIGPRLIVRVARELGIEERASQRARGSARLRVALASRSARVAVATAVMAGVLTLGVGLGASLFREATERDAARVEAPAEASAEQAVAATSPARAAAARGDSAPPVASPPPPIVAESALPPSEPPAASGSGETAAQNDALALALAASPPAAVTARAVDAALSAWGEPLLAATSFGVADALAACTGRGFTLLALTGSRIEDLATLGYPAFVVLPASDGTGRLAWLRGASPKHVTLEGVGSGSLEIDRETFARHWSGEAFVPWRDFESLPDTLHPGAIGEAVSWLQRALAGIGFSSVASTGEFDLRTHAAVLAFQQNRGLEADGTVGPRTKMALYRALGRHALPPPVASAASDAR